MTGSSLVERKELLDQAGISLTLERMAREIVAQSNSPLAGLDRVALVGIRTGGLVLAERLQKLIGAATGTTPPLGAVDIALYRDDLFRGLPRPEVGPTELPFELPGKIVVLVDDVLYTGRTIRAALDALMDFGRPRAVRLAVLVDRGLRELPIGADVVGIKVETTPEQVVRVELQDRGDDERVVLKERVRP